MASQPSRQTALLSLTGMVAVVAMLGLWLWRTPDPNQPTNEPTAPSLRSEPLNTDNQTDCPTDLPESTEIPSSGPEVTWQIHRHVPLPFSGRYGPLVIDGDIASCYARSPEGALIAVVQSPARILTTPEPRATSEAMAAESAGRDILIERLEDRGFKEAQPGELCTLVGFRFVDYTPDRATIATALRCPSGVIQQGNQTVLWSGDTWLLKVEPDGTTVVLPVAIPDLTGFIPWGGV